jgi:hypothetical protein
MKRHTQERLQLVQEELKTLDRKDEGIKWDRIYGNVNGHAEVVRIKHYTQDEIHANARAKEQKQWTQEHQKSSKQQYLASPYGANDWRSREQSRIEGGHCIMM